MTKLGGWQRWQKTRGRTTTARLAAAFAHQNVDGSIPAIGQNHANPGDRHAMRRETTAPYRRLERGNCQIAAACVSIGNFRGRRETPPGQRQDLSSSNLNPSRSDMDNFILASASKNRDVTAVRIYTTNGFG